MLAVHLCEPHLDLCNLAGKVVFGNAQRVVKHALVAEHLERKLRSLGLEEEGLCALELLALEGNACLGMGGAVGDRAGMGEGQSNCQACRAVIPQSEAACNP